jgi:hypothetical protein
LRGRFGPEFKLQDYTPHDLAAILRVVVKRKGLLLASSLSDDDLAGLFGRVPKAVIAQYNGSFWQLSFCAVAYHPHGRVVLWCVWGSILVSGRLAGRLVANARTAQGAKAKLQYRNLAPEVYPTHLHLLHATTPQQTTILFVCHVDVVLTDLCMCTMHAGCKQSRKRTSTPA